MFSPSKKNGFYIQHGHVSRKDWDFRHLGLSANGYPSQFLGILMGTNDGKLWSFGACSFETHRIPDSLPQVSSCGQSITNRPENTVMFGFSIMSLAVHPSLTEALP